MNSLHRRTNSHEGLHRRDVLRGFRTTLRTARTAGAPSCVRGRTEEGVHRSILSEGGWRGWAQEAQTASCGSRRRCCTGIDGSATVVSSAVRPGSPGWFPAVLQWTSLTVKEMRILVRILVLGCGPRGQEMFLGTMRPSVGATDRRRETWASWRGESTAGGPPTRSLGASPVGGTT